MRAIGIGILAALALPSAALAAPDIVACDSLVAARRLDAAGSRDPSGETGCVRIAGDKVGPMERRAMIGGAPYECRTIAERSACLWVVP